MDNYWSVQICERTSNKWLRRKHWRVATSDDHTIIDDLAYYEFADQIVKNHNEMVDTFKSFEAKLAEQSNALKRLSPGS